MWSEWWNRFIASDPALRRLRTATRVTLAVGLTLAIMIPLLARWGQPLPLTLIGAVVAINSSLAVNDTTRSQQKLTTLLMPLPAAVSLFLATLTAPLMWLSSLVFLLVIFVATYIRRFGPRFFALGMVAFMGYFFAMFLRPQFAQVPYLVAAALCGALAAFGMRFLLLPDNPEGILGRGRRTLRAQTHGLLHSVRDVAEHPDSTRRRRRLHNRSTRLNETALMLENTVQQLDALDEASRDRLRQRILDVELAAENLLTPLLRIIDHPSGGTTVPRALGALLAVLRTDPSEIREAARTVADRVEREESAEVAMAIRRLGAGLADLTAAGANLGGQRPDEIGDAETTREDEPADGGTGLQRPETRTAIQVTCATALAIVLGQLISPNRWYWAVITAFVVFISVDSRGELLVRAWQRTAGTMLGVIAGILVAVQVTGDVPAELSTILVCLFLAFYFAGYSYAVMTFFITTMLGAVYGMMGTFQVAVLETRLAETALGATAGVVTAAFVLPTRTRSLVMSRTEDFLLSVRDFLRSTGTGISEHTTVNGLRESVREIDDRLQQLLTSAHPLTGYRLRTHRTQVHRSMTIVGGCAYYLRNLVVSLPDTVEMVDDDTRGRLAELLWAMADTAESLTGDSGLDFATATEATRGRSEELNDIAESLTSGPTSLHHTIRLLDRVSQTLEDLAKERGVAGHATHRPA